jgi:hypothetical protein
MKKLTANLFFVIILIVLGQPNLSAQFSLSAQLRARGELRDGQGAPLSKGSKPAAFISQRSRLNAGFTGYRLRLGLSLQDVRVWGQDVSQINKNTTETNNGLMLHEAWAEILLSDTANKKSAFSVKLGRQEIIYDDHRLLGNLDWLQQARRHDAMVMRYERGKWMLHVGAAYNQNKENASGTIYNSVSPGYAATTNGGTMYKSMQYLYAGKKFEKGNASFLLLSDQFNRYEMQTVEGTAAKSFVPGVWTRVTTGFYYTNRFKAIDLSACAYYQTGKNNTGQKLDAMMTSLSVQRSFGKISVGPGVDYTSGGGDATKSKAFDPLYGTAHKFWGFMDYFYAGSPFGKAGLVDYYLKAKLKSSSRFGVGLDYHHFNSATGSERNLGDEIDLVGTYALTKQISIEGGYSHYFSTALLTSPSVKNVADARSSANWAYVMVAIRPEFIFKN